MERLAELAQYDQAFNGSLIDDDFLAAGFTSDEVSSYRSQTAPQPMMQPDRQAMADQYGTLQEPDYTLRERTVQGSQDILSNTFGMDPYDAGVMSRSILGDPNSTRSNYGVGLADFTPLGAVFGAEEGSRTASRGYEAGDPVQMGLGGLEVLLGAAEGMPIAGKAARPLSKAVINTVEEVFDTPFGGEVLGYLRGARDLDLDFLRGRGDPSMSQGVGADVTGRPPLTFDEVEAAMAEAPDAPVKQSAAEMRRQANIQRFGYDPNEAPEIVDTSYRGGHQPRGPQDENPIRLDDITTSTTGERGGYPSDFYGPNGQRYYAPGPRFADDEFGMANKESYRAIINARGNPDAEVTMYRAVPNEDSITSINQGDFVTLSPKYAEIHGADGYGPSGNDAGKVISQKVKVKDLYFAGDDVNEFGYFPDAPTGGSTEAGEGIVDGAVGLDVSRSDASNIFGEGSERVRYTDPSSGGTMEVVVKPDGSASVLELEVPEEFRGRGIGQKLQQQVLEDFPMMGGQVSSKAAATTAYRLGRRPPSKPNATLEEVFADIDEMSSVNMVSPEMQSRFGGASAPASQGIKAYHGSPHDFD